jgi:hypothetical protein
MTTPLDQQITESRDLFKHLTHRYAWLDNTFALLRACFARRVTGCAQRLPALARRSRRTFAAGPDEAGF